MGANGQFQQCHNDHNNSSSSNYHKHNYNKAKMCDNLNNCNSNHWPHLSNNNRIYAIKGFSKGLVEPLWEVWVVLLGKTLAETVALTWGPDLVEEVRPKILEGTLAVALAQRIVSLEVEEDLAARLD